MYYLNLVMKFFLSVVLTLLSSVSFSESEVYYCVGDKSYVFYSTSSDGEPKDGTLKPGRYTVKIDLENKIIQNEELDMWDPNRFSFTVGEDKRPQKINCGEYQNVLRCDNSLGSSFSFNPDSREFLSVRMNDGSMDFIHNGKVRYVQSEFGKCERFD